MTEQTTKNERKPKKKKKKNKALQVIKMLFIIFIAVSIIGAGVAGAVVYNIVKDAPKVNPNNLYSLLDENSFILDQNGELIEKVERGGLRTNIAYQDIPEDLINAFVSIEDKTFWEHNGFNFIRMIGAVRDSLTKNVRIGGTSTLTQQLARNLYLPEKMEERSYTRKIEEAYYAVMLEKHLSKEQIIEAYMNTVYLGYGAYGVEAASYAYFSKGISELSIAESAVIAGIMKNPARYSPVKRLDNIDVDPNDPDILSSDETYTLLYDDRFKDRQELVLALMHQENYITDAEYEEALAVDMRTSVKPSSITTDEISSYFVDMVKEEAAQELMDYYDISEADAYEMLYNQGLKIYSTLDLRIQKIVEEEYDDPTNFPAPSIKAKDAYGNIMDKQDNILLYLADNMFNENEDFVIRSYEYEEDAEGNITIYRNRKLQFDAKYEGEELKDIQIHIKDHYMNEDSTFTIVGDGIIKVPPQYKSFDENNNLVISSDYFINDPEFKMMDGDNILVASRYYTLSSPILQPQSSMVILDYETGQIKALVGGRNIEGKLLYNRALEPNQPGSSIKPLAVYTPALDKGFTTATVFDDAPMLNADGAIWPNNWYTGFKGLVTLREAVHQSINVVAVKIMNQITPTVAIEYLKDFGITTVQETGAYNDVNAAALALGGMTRGISPLELTAAYGTLANRGMYVEPIILTRIEDKYGNIIIDKTPKMRKVLDSDVAFLMTDVLVSTASDGLSWRAKIYDDNKTIPVGGKTGTTNSNYDAWFMGVTPYYAGGIWIGNDVDFALSQGSSTAAQLFGKIMKRVHEGYEPKDFYKPENIISVEVDTISGKLPSSYSYMDPRGTVKYETFIEGTEPTEVDDYHVAATIDTANGFLATPFCPAENREMRVFVKRPYPRSQFVVQGLLINDKNRHLPIESIPMGVYQPDDMIYELPIYYCPAHNPDVNRYPIAPLAQVPSDTTDAAIETAPEGQTSPAPISE